MDAGTGATIVSEHRPKRAARSRQVRDVARPATKRPEPAVTPDGRYIVVRGRLWRRADPALPPERRSLLVAELMDARRSVGAALRREDVVALAEARARVDSAKIGLGERGPVWWSDGAPDQNRRMARNTGYAGWFAPLEDPA
jgi:hypothetical protein